MHDEEGGATLNPLTELTDIHLTEGSFVMFIRALILQRQTQQALIYDYFRPL